MVVGAGGGGLLGFLAVDVLGPCACYPSSCSTLPTHYTHTPNPTPHPSYPPPHPPPHPTALCKDPVQRPGVLDMLHHTWVEMFRARRSMRILQASPLQQGADATAADGDAAPAAPAASIQAAAASGSGSPKKGAYAGQVASLQQVEDMLGGVLHSAASSPCLGTQSAFLGPLPATSGPIVANAQPKMMALGQLSRLAAPALLEGPATAAEAALAVGDVRLSPPMPMEM